MNTAINDEYERGIAEMKQENVFIFRIWDCETAIKVKDGACRSTSSDELFSIFLGKGATKGCQSVQSLIR